jgi:hypothetical protein
MDSSVTRRGLAVGLGAVALAGSARAQEAAPQDERPKGFDRLAMEGRYLPLWRETVGPPLKGFNSQWAAFVGEERVALAGRNPSLTDPLTDDATAQDAVAAIVEAARGRRVVMLNESHSASRHRLFLARVARALRPEGFDILAAETFSNRADGEPPGVESMQAGAPFSPGYGYYTHDPIFADAAREALGLGYRLKAYEQRPDQFDRPPGNLAGRQSRRLAGGQSIFAGAGPCRLLPSAQDAGLGRQPVAGRALQGQDRDRPPLRQPGLYRLVRAARPGPAPDPGRPGAVRSQGPDRGPRRWQEPRGRDGGRRPGRLPSQPAGGRWPPGLAGGRQGAQARGRDEPQARPARW